MLAQEIIRKKRDGVELSPYEISAFVATLADDTLADSQAAAFAMAVFFKGMSEDETVALTLAMRNSGTVLSWPGINRPIADKHSTGGIGDNVSLMLAPIAAAAGLAVPMISGRGLGPTGGTVDKLESVPGYNVSPEPALLRRVVANAGCAIIGQTDDLAPADKRLYAIRDLTATVDSMPLIASSILSKKLAAGLETLVLDVKYGNGAFMERASDATTLAKLLVKIASGSGLPTTALVTDMNEPLADAVGNTVEIENTLAFLSGKKSGTRLEEIVLSLASEMILGGGLAQDYYGAGSIARNVLANGTALEIFAKMISGLGGPIDFVEKPNNYLQPAPFIRPVKAHTSGYLSAVDSRAIGMSVVSLGGGRKRAGEKLDHRVGYSALTPLGMKVEVGEPLGFAHAASENDCDLAIATLLSAVTIGDNPSPPRPLVLERVTA